MPVDFEFRASGVAKKINSFHFIFITPAASAETFAVLSRHSFRGRKWI